MYPKKWGLLQKECLVISRIIRRENLQSFFVISAAAPVFLLIIAGNNALRFIVLMSWELDYVFYV